MQPPDDSALLRQYTENQSDEAFTALVTRHVNLVYSVALRHVGNTYNAEEITQAVFIILARKAGQLRHDKALSSWLFQTTRLTANNFLRSEARRHHREEEAYMRAAMEESGDDIWPKIGPLLDAAVAGLREQDRRALVLRFYEGRSLREVGAVLGASEDAAEKRVNRALEKLRKFFTRRGVALSAVAIAGAMSANSVQAAPSGLAVAISAGALAKGAAAGGSTLTLAKGALKIMAWTKVKTAIVVGAAVILTTGTATMGINEIMKNRDPSWLAGQGWQLWQAGRSPEAAEKFNRAVELDPKDTNAWNGLGWAYFSSGKMQAAGQAFQKVLSLDPNHPAALNGLGQISLAQKKYDDAEAYFLQAAPGAPAACFGLARIYLLEGKFDQAEQWARKVEDSGQGNNISKMMLQAAQDKQLSPKLRALIEPR
jgi:RNA polymerase sigma factor (sigma-70 family)